MKDINSLFSPEATLLRNISTGHRKKEAMKIIYHGLVAYVDRQGIEGRTRYSCRVKPVGASDPENQDWDSVRFYPPLLPPHICAVPEVGEEVLLIFEEPGNLDTAFWVNRVSKANKLQFTEIGEDIETDDDTMSRANKYGSITLPKEGEKDTPNPDYPDNNPRTKAGDVVGQGRSNTYLRHSFDVKNKKGTIEVITEEEPKSLADRNALNYRKSDGARTLYATLSDIDTLIIEQLYNLTFDADFTKYGQNKSLDTAYLLLEAIQLRLVSREGKKVQHAVLAEEQQRWLEELIRVIRVLIDHILQLTNDISQHRHMANGPTSPPLPTIGKLEEFTTNRPQDFRDDKTALEDMKETTLGGIKAHHSEKVALN